MYVYGGRTLVVNIHLVRGSSGRATAESHHFSAPGNARMRRDARRSVVTLRGRPFASAIKVVVREGR